MALLLSLVCEAADAQISPSGDQFQVNTCTSGGQRHSTIARGVGDSTIVVWQSRCSSGSDPFDSVQGRLFLADGSPAGSEFQVNTTTSSTQAYPSVASDASGAFVVTWAGYGIFGGDQSGSSINAQRFDASGSPLGSEFQVNAYTIDQQTKPEVASGAGGRFVVVWESRGSGGNDSDGWSVQARSFNSDGVALGRDVQVNSYTTGRQFRAHVAADIGGGFVVVWESYGSLGSDTSDTSIQARRFDPDGDPIGDEFQVNTLTTGYQSWPSVVNTEGGFVVVWSSSVSGGSDDSYESIQARIYDADGVALGDEFQVNDFTSSYQGLPKVGAAGDRGFVVTWSSYGSPGTDSSYSSVQARRFDADGAPRDVQFQVNNLTTSQQFFSAANTDSDGNLFVTWTSSVSPGNDTSSYSVQARLFDALFRDGFESGNTGRWSAALL